MQMTASSTLAIGDVRIEVSCPLDLAGYGPDASYDPFVAGANETDRIEVQISPGGIINTGGLTRVFESGQSWNLYRIGEELLMELRPPSFGEALWQARWDPQEWVVRLSCGDAFQKEVAGRKTVVNPVRYPLDQILLMHFLTERSGAIIHAACIGMDKKAFIVAGRSGAGKSTITGFFGSDRRALPLSDDRTIVRKQGGSFRAYGTPWSGEGRIARNEHLPLSAIFFLRQSDRNEAGPLSPQEAVKRLLPVTSVPWYDADAMSGVLTFCEEMLSHVPSWDLFFRRDESVVDFVCEVMNRPGDENED